MRTTKAGLRASPFGPISILVVAAALLAGACTGDDTNEETVDPSTAGSPGTAESDPFCAALEPVAEIDPDALPSADDLDLVRQARDAAPEDVQDSFDLIIEVGENLVSSETANPYDGIDVEEFDAASLELSATAKEECDLDVPLFVGVGGDGGGSTSSSAGAAGYETDELRDQVAASDPDIGDRIGLTARVNDEVTIQIQELDGPEEAVTACELVVDYFDTIDFDATLVVADTDSNEVARRDPGGDCTSV